MNQKNLRVKHLVERGVTNVARIARKLGYGDPPTKEGIERVIDAAEALKLPLVECENGLEVSVATPDDAF